MAPDSEELIADRPLVGPAGKLFWTMLKRAGLDRADCYIVNCIGEWPEGKYGLPSKAQLDAWWDRFDGATGLFRGRVALLLGGSAFARFTGLGGGVVAWGGYLLPALERIPLSRTRQVTVAYKTSGKDRKKGDPRIVQVHETLPPPSFQGLCIPALDPAGVLRSGFTTAPILNAQVKKAVRALRGELISSRTHYSTHPVIWGSCPVIAADIETGGIGMGIVRLGLAREDDAFSVPWTAQARSVAQPILGRPETEYLFHNAGFDLPRLAAADVHTAGPIRDTMLAAALLQPDLPKGLNACGALYLDCPRWKHLDQEDPAKYNALDAIRTFELWKVEKHLLQNTGQLSLFTDVIMAGLPTLIKMGTRGIAISEPRREEWLGTLRQEGNKELHEWTQRSGGCNYASPMQLGKFFKSKGMELPLSKDGGETTDKQGLARLAGDYPEHANLIALLMRVRGIFKDIETYALVPTGSDGRVHASFVPAYKDEDQLGKGIAGTWRITAKEPNLQNQPERARRMYVPSPGMAFVGADYSQLEARILGWLSGDMALLADCDGDIHTRNAARLGVDKTRAKNGFYGWSYLAGGRTLQNTFAGRGYKVSLKECEALLSGFDSTYARAASFRHGALAIAQAQRYVQNPFGLRRYFPHQKFPAPSAMSTLIQSTGAIMMWIILPLLDAAMSSLGGRLLLTVHDDVLAEVPIGQETRALSAIREIMERRFPEVAPDFHVPVTLKTSPSSWGELTAA